MARKILVGCLGSWGIQLIETCTSCIHIESQFDLNSCNIMSPLTSRELWTWSVCLQRSERVHLWRYSVGILGQPRRPLQVENCRQVVCNVRLRDWLPKRITVDW